MALRGLLQNLTQFSDNKELKQQQQQEQGKQRRQEIELAQNYKNNNYKLHLTINANGCEHSHVDYCMLYKGNW